MITPEYTRKAIEKYNSKFDRVTIRLKKGTRAAVESLADVSSVNDYICGLVYDDLRRRGVKIEDGRTQEQKEITAL